MKRILTAACAVLALGMMLTGCLPDDQTSTYGKLEYNLYPRTIVGAYQEYCGPAESNPAVTEINLILLTQDGWRLRAHLCIPSGQKLVAGTYQCTSSDAPDAMTFWYARFQNDYGQEDVEITGGGIQITAASSDNYQMTFDLGTATGKTLTGNFDGKLSWKDNTK